jgi:ribosome maturation factor RimP
MSPSRDAGFDTRPRAWATHPASPGRRRPQVPVYSHEQDVEQTAAHKQRQEQLLGGKTLGVDAGYALHVSGPGLLRNIVQPRKHESINGAKTHRRCKVLGSHRPPGAT